MVALGNDAVIVATTCSRESDVAKNAVRTSPKQLGDVCAHIKRAFVRNRLKASALGAEQANAADARMYAERTKDRHASHRAVGFRGHSRDRSKSIVSSSD